MRLISVLLVLVLIVPLFVMAQGTPKDDQIYDAVRRRLADDADVKGAGFEVTVKNGKTTVHKRLVDNPTEQQWLRQMHLWREDHRWSFHGIAAELNRRRVPTKTDKLGGWQSGNVAKALASKHTARFLVRQTAFEAAA